MGHRRLISNDSTPVSWYSPELSLSGDFYVEFEVSLKTIGVTLIGDGGPDFTWSFIENYGPKLRLPDLALQSLNGVGLSSDRTTTIRLERRGNLYTVILDSDDRKQFNYSYTHYRGFRGIKLDLGASGPNLYAFRAGPLPTTKSDSEMAEYSCRFSNKMPENWSHVATRSTDGFRIASMPGAISITGDFELGCAVQLESDSAAILKIVLVDSKGSRSLPVVLREYYGMRLSCPNCEEQHFHRPKDGKIGLTIRRSEGFFEVAVPKANVSLAFEDTGLGDFDQIIFDNFGDDMFLHGVGVKPL